MKNRVQKIFIAVSLFISSYSFSQYKTTGSVERYDSAISKIISPNAKAEIIAEGFKWSEGPLWIEKEKMLLFSDVPMNTIYKWTEAKGLEVYLTPSGYTDTIKRGGETGSNGLLLDNKGRLVLCQHGNRQMARMNSDIKMPSASFTALVSKYNGIRFNSPNDATYNSKGELFFTDPPYGLEKGANDPKKETSFNGVYKLTNKGEVVLLVDSLTRPNGIGFLPGEKTLLVANSDGAKPNWYAFDIDVNGQLSNARIFYNAATTDRSLKGSPDGLKVDRRGNVFATGPGGIWILTKEGKLLGKLRLTEPASNCALSGDEKTLYITNNMQVLRFKMRD